MPSLMKIRPVQSCIMWYRRTRRI